MDLIRKRGTEAEDIIQEMVIMLHRIVWLCVWQQGSRLFYSEARRQLTPRAKPAG